MDCGSKWLIDFNAEKTQLVSFDVKMVGFVLEEKSSFKVPRLTFSSKLDWGTYIISIAGSTSSKIGALIRSMKFRSPQAALISINLPYDHAWNTAVISGLVLLVATWNCWISYKNKYVGLLVLHFLPVLNP